MTETTKSFLMLVGRILISAIFLASGVMKIMDWQGVSQQMTGEGMVAVPVFLVLAILFELGGGLAVLLGCCTRIGALALFLFLIPVTFVFHDFWTYQGMAMQNQMQHFFKNVAIMGGLLAIAAAGAGAFSIDARWRGAARREVEERRPVGV